MRLFKDGKWMGACFVPGLQVLFSLV